ncbi:MAG: hypothetical protein ACAI43_17185 [Phycisphaerae bacterium]|nr:hypothetical protein [Tepidisphaeraceae bacterium]
MHTPFQPTSATAPAAAAPETLAAALARRERGLTLGLALAVTPVLILIFFLKFAADVSGPIVQRVDVPPMLTSYDNYWWHANQHPAMTARFAGNYSVYYLAKGIERITGIPADPRLHPIRLAAAIASIFWLWVGALPVLLDRSGRWDWRTFYAAFLGASCVALFAYTPYDLPSLAFTSLGLWAVIHRRPAWALLWILLGNPFRESLLHVVFFAGCTLLIPRLRMSLAWIAALTVAFFAEWYLIRRFYPVPSAFTIKIFGDLLSPTLWASVGLCLWFAGQAGLSIARRVAAGGWSPLDRFFTLQILALLPWLLFYKLNNGNLAEFRMLLPVVLPLMFALAYRGEPAGSMSREPGN